MAIFSGYAPMSLKYSIDYESTGKNPMVAPYSGDIFAIVALSVSERLAQPGPKNSTN